MTTLEIILTAILWLITGLFLFYKQCQCGGDKDTWIVIIPFAPIALIFVIIRQVFVERWR